MNNAEKFKEIFKKFATEVWAFPEKDFLTWLNAEYKDPTTKKDLGVDCISRADAIQAMQDKAKKLTNEDTINGLCGAVAILFDLPSVSSVFEKNSKKLEKDFGELDCISRADAIRVASGYCHPSNVAKELAKLPSMGRYDHYTDKFIKE